MNIEQEILDIKQEIRDIKKDLTELKELLCYNKLVRAEDFLTATDAADLLNNRKYMCLICNKAKPAEEFDQYNNETYKGICKKCLITHFPGNE